MQALRVKKLYDGTMNAPVSDAVVVLDGEKILDVLTPADAGKLARYNLTAEDYSQFYMIPGLIDSHVHLDQCGDGRPYGSYDSDFTDGYRQIIAADNARDALRAGVTVLFDCGSCADITLNLRNYINDGRMQGPDIMVCGGAIMQTGGHGCRDENVADGEDGVRLRVRQLAEKGVDFIKVMGTTRGGPKHSRPCYGYTDEEFRAVFAEAHRLGYQATVHATFPAIIRRVIECGVDCVEHCNFFNQAWTKVDKDKAAADFIRESGVMVCHTMAANSGFLDRMNHTPKELWTEAGKALYVKEKDLADRVLESFAFQMEMGIPTITGTDSGFSYTSFQHGMHDAMERMVLGGLSNLEVIHASTARSAKYHKLDQLLGSVAPGLQADLVLLRRDPGEDMSAIREVAQVFKKGVPVL